MALRKRRHYNLKCNVEVLDYTTLVPFYNLCTVCEVTLISNDTLEPLSEEKAKREALVPIPGAGAIYRFIGDGSHAPVFSSAFKKSSVSGNYDSNVGVLNLVTFLYDGTDYWYSIIQAAV